MQNVIENIKDHEFKSVDEILDATQLDFPVEKREIATIGEATVDDIKVIGKTLNSSYVITDDHGIPLGHEVKARASVVSDQYEIIPQREAFSLADGLIELGATVRSYGILEGGKKSFLELDLGAIDIAKMPQSDDSNRKDSYGFGNQADYSFDADNPGTNSKGQQVGDIINRLFTITVSHDGSSNKGSMHYERLVCLNGLRRRTKGSEIKIRHCKSYQDIMVEARKDLGLAQIYYEWFEEKCRELYNTPIEVPVAKVLLDQLYPDPPANEKTGKVNKGAGNKRDEMLKNFQSGQGNSGKTYWDLYNGVTEYLTHHFTDGKEIDTYKSLMAGGGGRGGQIDKAFDLFTDHAKESREVVTA